MNKIATHDSSIRHTTGQAIYIDDIPDQENLLHGALVLSKCAHGKIKKIDFSRLKNLPFQTKTVTAENIPGENEIGPIKTGEPILADHIITYFGQPVAVVLAKSFQEAQYASDLVKIEIEHLEATKRWNEECCEKEEEWHNAVYLTMLDMMKSIINKNKN